MKYSERKISQCILPFKQIYLTFYHWVVNQYYKLFLLSILKTLLFLKGKQEKKEKNITFSIISEKVAQDNQLFCKRPKCANGSFSEKNQNKKIRQQKQQQQN